MTSKLKDNSNFFFSQMNFLFTPALVLPHSFDGQINAFGYQYGATKTNHQTIIKMTAATAKATKTIKTTKF